MLTESLDAAIIVMVILTTFLAPPLLRLVFVDKDVDEPPLKESDSLATVTQAPNQD